MFLGKDERLILFNQRTHPPTRELLIGFAGAGIETVKLSARWVSWHEIEPSPGEWNWSVVDEIIDTVRSTGLKAMLDIYWRAPDWLDGCIDQPRTEGTPWLGRDGVFPGSWRAVNPFDGDALLREAEFLERLCERYAEPGVLCVYAMPYGGERVLPFGMGPYTEQQCADLVVGRQRIFAKYYDELWAAWHPFHAKAITSSVDRSTPPHVGNEHLWACYEAMKEAFPTHTLNQFLSEVFAHGGLGDCHIDGVKVWGGAEYVTGVVGNSAKIRAHGLWGLIMGTQPCYSGPGQLRPDAYDRVEQAIVILAQQYQ